MHTVSRSEMFPSDQMSTAQSFPNTTTTSKLLLLIAATHRHMMNLTTRPKSTSGHKRHVSHGSGYEEKQLY